MSERAIVRKGDKTSHGGVVIEGHPTASLFGQPIALVGHQVSCPKCKGTFPILPDDGRNHQFMGQDTAVEGMRAACGAVLIASQTMAKLSAGAGQGSGEGINGAFEDPAAQSDTLCLECLESAAENAATTVPRG